MSTLDFADEKGPLGLTTLYEPQSDENVVAELVFIHGLGGGSRKTWSFSPDPSHYWPQAWLPDDDEFADAVRVHTFGYKADWTDRRRSMLGLHEFAQSLVNEMRNHPAIRRASTRIVLIAHSMGGWVAKNACVLARQDTTAAELAERIHSLFFLATPHRGSDMAALLKSILLASWGGKPFLADLSPCSSAMSAIADAFRHIAPDLRLWSFFETLPVRGRIIVDKHAATLGYHNEECAAINADHRHVCKFDTPNNPGFKTLRNALTCAIDTIRSESTVSESRALYLDVTALGHSRRPSLSPPEAISSLRGFLGRVQDSEDDLAELQTLKQPSSCLWFTEQTAFNSWSNGSGPPVFWVMGRPASGKSVLASHVIDYLRDTSNPAYCSFLICKHSKGGGGLALSDCFRSLAFQMASQDRSVREALLQLAHNEDGLVWEILDESSVWRRLFIGCIFKLPSINLQRHCWVLDGLDECASFGALFTKRLLATLPSDLRIFATSRPVEEIKRGLASFGTERALVQTLCEADTLEDMRLFVSAKLAELGRPEDRQSREEMCEKITKKSAGSFLWTRLILEEFETTWTKEAMHCALSKAPTDLFELYARMARSVESDPRRAVLAKTILSWIVLASRPLTVEELRCAVRLDINQTLQNASRAIPDICGQLVFVGRDGSVNLIHDTVREFLLVGSTFGLSLAVGNKKEVHTRLASVLLRYLSGGTLSPARESKFQRGGMKRNFYRKGFDPLTPAEQAPLADNALLDYACSSFSEHIYRSTSADHALMEVLCEFLRGKCILSWVEYTVKSGDPGGLVRAAVNLREYHDRRLKYVPPTDLSIQLVDSWVTDLIRVSAKFCTQLLMCPSSIHRLIPPLCPPDSAISRTFTASGNRTLYLTASTADTLDVKGLPSGSWDDCLIRIQSQNGEPTAVCHGGRFFAIGFSTGQVSLYDIDSFQETYQLKHPERVKMLQFSPDFEDSYIALCGVKSLVVCCPRTASIVHSFSLCSPPVALAFFEIDQVACATQSGEMMKWYVFSSDGMILHALHLDICLIWKKPRQARILADLAV